MLKQGCQLAVEFHSDGRDLWIAETSDCSYRDWNSAGADPVSTVMRFTV
jgi:hypothetical protein